MKIVLTISGMHCASCAFNVERSLKKISGINDVRVSTITNKAFLESEQNVNQEDIKKAVSKAGYNVVELEIE